MNLDDVIEVGDSKINLARNSYVVSFVGRITIVY